MPGRRPTARFTAGRNGPKRAETGQKRAVTGLKQAVTGLKQAVTGQPEGNHARSGRTTRPGEQQSAAWTPVPVRTAPICLSSGSCSGLNDGVGDEP